MRERVVDVGPVRERVVDVGPVRERVVDVGPVREGVVDVGPVREGVVDVGPVREGVVDIGLISDTHGLVRAEALAALAGVAHVVHAGDVGGAHVLEALARVAPVTTVRGNNDFGAWADGLPETARVTIARARILVLHDAHELAGRALDDIDVVVAGHSHRPLIERRDGLLHVNPGSAGPRRFRLPIALARLSVGPHGIAARIVDLAPGA